MAFSWSGVVGFVSRLYVLFLSGVVVAVVGGMAGCRWLVWAGLWRCLECGALGGVVCEIWLLGSRSVGGCGRVPLGRWVVTE